MILIFLVRGDEIYFIRGDDIWQVLKIRGDEMQPMVHTPISL